jgi:PAS domain S-box-containing protein
MRSPLSDDVRFRRLLLRAALLPALLMAAVAAALGWQVHFLREVAQRVDHTDVVLAQVNLVARLQLEHENGLRGYLLANDRAYLENYRAAERAIGPALERLEQLVSDNPGQLERARRLRDLGGAWQRRAAETLAAREAGGDPAAVAALGERREILDSFRQETARFVDIEERLRVDRSARAQRASDVALATTILASLFVGVALAFLTRAQMHLVEGIHGRTAREAEERAQALAESEERFRLFVEGVHDSAIYMLDTEGHVRSWNSGAERMKRYEPDEVVGRHFSIFYTAEDAASGVPERELAQAAAKGQVEGESWRVRKDGSRFWAGVTMRALRDRDGRLVGYAKLVRDATERKRAEMRRAAQYGVARVLSEASGVEEALPRLLEAVASALGYDLAVAWMPRDGVLRVTGSWLRPSSHGESFLTVMRPLTLRRGEGLVGRVWATGAPGWVEDIRREMSQPRAPQAMEAGLHSALVFAVPAGGETAAVLQLFACDPRARDPELLQLATSIGIQIGTFIERQRQEDASREAERRRAEELERRVAERTTELTAVNRELESFSYSVSHDLRAPLRALDGFSQVLLEDYADRIDAQGKDYLGRIRAASQRMSALIDDLIQLSRVTRSELRRDDVDLSALVRAVVAEVQEREPGRRVDVTVQDGVHVRGDQRLLRVGLVNLVGNAFKFTRQRADARMEFGVTSGAEGRVYHVRDNGAGFDMAYAGKLFQPFQRLHTPHEFEGTGIGLATVQRIVHRHGGRVWAEGAPGEGATFYFTLGDF